MCCRLHLLLLLFSVISTNGQGVEYSYDFNDGDHGWVSDIAYYYPYELDPNDPASGNYVERNDNFFQSSITDCPLIAGEKCYQLSAYNCWYIYSKKEVQLSPNTTYVVDMKVNAIATTPHGLAYGGRRTSVKMGVVNDEPQKYLENFVGTWIENIPMFHEYHLNVDLWNNNGGVTLNLGEVLNSCYVGDYSGGNSTFEERVNMLEEVELSTSGLERYTITTDSEGSAWILLVMAKDDSWDEIHYKEVQYTFTPEADYVDPVVPTPFINITEQDSLIEINWEGADLQFSYNMVNWHDFHTNSNTVIISDEHTERYWRLK